MVKIPNSQSFKIVHIHSIEYDPLLTVNDDAILCIGQDPKSDFLFKLLGRQLQWELTNTKIIEKLDALIEEWLGKVNAISMPGTIYN